MFKFEAEIVDALRGVERAATLIDLYGADITRLQDLRKALEAVQGLRSEYQDGINKKVESNPTLKDIYKL